MSTKTYAQLTAATDVADGDLLATYRGSGPLKRITALLVKGYMQTGALLLDGSATMTAPLLLAVGSVGSPSLTFTGDADSGLYHIGANDFGMAVNGVKQAEISVLGLTLRPSSTTGAGLSLPPGTAPTSPIDGDLWRTSSGLFAYVGSTTQQLAYASDLTDFAGKSADNSWTGTNTFTGSSSKLALVIRDAAEVVTVSATAATGTIAIYPSTQSVLYYTSSAAANWTVNLTFSAGTTLNTALATGQSLSAAFLVTQGNPAYYNTVVQVDGTTSGVTTKWLNGPPSSGTASGIDVYTYTVIKTGSAAFTVLATVGAYA